MSDYQTPLNAEQAQRLDALMTLLGAEGLTFAEAQAHAAYVVTGQRTAPDDEQPVPPRPSAFQPAAGGITAPILRTEHHVQFGDTPIGDAVRNGASAHH